jgi:transposase InsO family protein
VRWITVFSVLTNAVPIRSVKFRDRAQVDLIDFRKHAKKNEFGIVMRWIVNIKDHYTGFTVIDCIPRKRAKYVAYVLAKHFSILGFPSILHTDNGKEFVAKEVIRKMKELSPHLTTITGRPRTPRDQGSVERSNKVVKDMLYSYERQQRINGKIPNWTQAIPHMLMQASIVRNRMENMAFLLTKSFLTCSMKTMIEYYQLTCVNARQ